MMHLIRCLWFFTAVFDIYITVTHIVEIANNAADMLSRNQANKFLTAFPHISTSPTPLQQSLFHLASPGLDVSPVQKVIQEYLLSVPKHCSLLNLIHTRFVLCHFHHYVLIHNIQSCIMLYNIYIRHNHHPWQSRIMCTCPLDTPQDGRDQGL